MISEKNQVHEKFKAFAAVLDEANPFEALSNQVTQWVSQQKVAPKSIGAEYIEALQHLILTVGYRDDEPAYAVKVTTVSLGVIPDLTPRGLAQLEAKMQAASARLRQVICHELYVTANQECFMVFLLHES